MGKHRKKASLFQLIDRKSFDVLVEKWGSDKWVTGLPTWELTCALINNPNYKGKLAKKGMSQRWLATCLLNAETGFKRVKGYVDISIVVTSIRKYHQEIVDGDRKKVG